MMNISRIKSCWLNTAEASTRQGHWWVKSRIITGKDEQLSVNSLYPLAGAEKGGAQAMVPFTARMLMIALCSWLRTSTSYRKKDRHFWANTLHCFVSDERGAASPVPLPGTWRILGWSWLTAASSSGAWTWWQQATGQWLSGCPQTGWSISQLRWCLTEVKNRLSCCFLYFVIYTSFGTKCGLIWCVLHLRQTGQKCHWCKAQLRGRWRRASGQQTGRSPVWAGREFVWSRRREQRVTVVFQKSE